jgi:Flp pilus assembly protein TadG
MGPRRRTASSTASADATAPVIGRASGFSIADRLAPLRRFRRDQRANIAVVFSVALLPVLTAVGCAVDYSQTVRVQAKLQAAADLASVASIAAKSPGYLAAAAMTGDGSVPAGATDAANIFNGNVSAAGSEYTHLSAAASVVKTGRTLTSTVMFSASVPVTFLQVLGYSSLTISSSAIATSALPAFLDFYLMLDVSGSMGLPSTAAEQARLAAINPDLISAYPGGCSFACHFSGSQGYDLSRDGGNPANVPVTACTSVGSPACIQLRVDAVGNAVNQLLVTANSAATVSNQYRIGLYPFIQNLYSYFPMTGSIAGSSSTPGTINYAAATLATLLDTGSDPNLGAGGTHFENALPSINGLISSVGGGTGWNDTLPFVVLITDGAEDSQTYSAGNWTCCNRATTLDPSLCTAIKSRGIQMAVLYIPYLPIQNPSPSFGGGEDIYANNNIPNIPPALQSCASPSYFFTANTPADITHALNTIFNQARSTARLAY